MIDARNQASNANINGNLAWHQAKDNSDKLDGLKNTQDHLVDTANNIDKNTKPRPPLTSPDLSHNQRPKNDNKRDDVSGLNYVEIVLTKLPPAGKSMSGNGSPNIYFCGWFEWSVSGTPLPREQILFENSLFLAPKEATGYAYCLVHGAEGYAIEHTSSS